MLNSGADEQVQEYIDLLYNQSLLLEGSKIKDPAAFARSVAKLMTGSAKGKDAAWLTAVKVIWKAGEVFSPALSFILASF